MTDRTAPLKELLAAAKFEPECSDTIHRQGCEYCEAPEANARWTARRKLTRLGYTNDRVGRTALDALIACSEALEKTGFCPTRRDTTFTCLEVALADQRRHGLCPRCDALAKVDALNV